MVASRARQCIGLIDGGNCEYPETNVIKLEIGRTPHKEQHSVLVFVQDVTVGLMQHISSFTQSTPVSQLEFHLSV